MARRPSARDIAVWLASNPFAPGRAQRLTTVQRDTLYPSPANHFRIFNVTSSQFEVYVDGAWQVEATGEDASGSVNDFFYTIGGFDSDFKTPWQYNAEGDSWAAGTDATENMIKTAGVVFNGDAYVPSTSSPYPTQKFAAESWTTLGNHPVVATDRAAAASAVGGHWYGYQSTSRLRCDKYTVDGDSYAAGINFPSAFRSGSAINVDGTNAIIHGGTDSFFGTYTAVDATRSHDTGGDTYTSKTASGLIRAEFGNFLIDGDFFAVGGQNNHLASVKYADCDSYNLTGDSWTARTDYPPTPAENGPTSVGLSSGLAYCTGGFSTKTSRSYAVDTWSTMADHGSAAGGYRAGMDSACAVVLP